MGGKLKLKVSLRKKKKKTHINRMNSKSPETHLFLETLNTVEEKRGKKASLCLSAQENVPKQSSPIRKNVILRLLIPLWYSSDNKKIRSTCTSCSVSPPNNTIIRFSGHFLPCLSAVNAASFFWVTTKLSTSLHAAANHSPGPSYLLQISPDTDSKHGGITKPLSIRPNDFKTSTLLVWR